jgi:prolyl-tRNA synthetase
MVNVLAIPVFTGRKIPQERFAGATNTLTCEAMMRDGKALQMGTSHELGQNFARAFDIGFQDENGERQLCWTTSWGVSTRMMGGLIMAHGDDAGLRVPPRVAAVQAVVLVVKDEDGSVTQVARDLLDGLTQTGVRARIDAQVATGFGRRATDWELKGVPLRIEVGPRDLGEGRVVIARRDTGEKIPCDLGELTSRTSVMLEEIQSAMLSESLADRSARTVDVTTVGEAREAASTGFARVPWAALADGGIEQLGKDAITVRCLQSADGGLPQSDDEPGAMALVARSY